MIWTPSLLAAGILTRCNLYEVWTTGGMTHMGVTMITTPRHKQGPLGLPTVLLQWTQDFQAILTKCHGG